MASTTAHTKKTVAVIGPALSGKTALLQSVPSALFLQTHGFDKSLFIQANSQSSPLGYPPNISPLTPFPISFSLSKKNWGSKKDAETVDLTHSTRTPIGTYELDLVECRLEHIHTQRQAQHILAMSDCLVLTLPLSKALSSQELDQLIALTNRIATGHFGSFTRCIVTLSKSERYFAPQGARALHSALDQNHLAQLIQTHIVNDQELMYVLNQLGTAISQTYLMPVSSFGYIKSTRQANVDPFADRPLITPFHTQEQSWAGHKLSLADQSKLSYRAGLYLQEETIKPNEQSEKDLRQQWLPYLTPDPFITAASGLVNPFTLPIEALQVNRAHPSFA